MMNVLVVGLSSFNGSSGSPFLRRQAAVIKCKKRLMRTKPTNVTVIILDMDGNKVRALIPLCLSLGLLSQKIIV
jgi:hypothetical protein